jgi:SAM-dependent methyltransferase
MPSPFSVKAHARKSRRAVRAVQLSALVMSAVFASTITETRGQSSMFAESAAYERFMGRWSDQLAPLLIRFTGIEARHDVLDIGSGTGALAFAVATAAPTARIVGIDPSAAYVAYAQSRVRRGNIQFAIGDAQRLQYPDRSFDRVSSLLVMNFIPDQSKALAEMARVTRPGGVISAAVWDYGDGMQMLRVFWDEAVAANPAIAKRDERNMPLCKPGELAALWRAQGLQDVSEQPLTIPLSFSSFDDYWQPFLGGQGPAGAYVAMLSDAEREALRQRLRKRLLGDGPDRGIAMQGRAWAVKGTVPKPSGA